MLILPLPLYTVPLVSRLAMNVLNSVSCIPDRFVLNNDRLQQNDSDFVHLVKEVQSGTYGLLIKSEVKMAVYWPSSFFACLWTETKSGSINSQRKNEANIQPS